jgi:hypothetical protein
MLESIASDLFQGLVVSALTGLLFWLWNFRAARRAAQKIQVVFASPDGAVCDPVVSIRRDEVSRAEILGRCGAAVGGFAAGVSFPGVDPVQLDAVKSGSAAKLTLTFTDATQFARAVEGIEIMAGRKTRPVGKKPEPAITRADLEDVEKNILEVIRDAVAAARVPTTTMATVERRLRLPRRV